VHRNRAAVRSHMGQEKEGHNGSGRGGRRQGRKWVTGLGGRIPGWQHRKEARGPKRPGADRQDGMGTRHKPGLALAGAEVLGQGRRLTGAEVVAVVGVGTGRVTWRCRRGQVEAGR